MAIQGIEPALINFLTYLGLSLVCFTFSFSLPWSSFQKGFWFYSIAAGIVGASGNFFLVKALQKGDLSILGPINAYKPVAAMVIAFLLLKEIPSLLGFFGVMLILAGSYVIYLGEKHVGSPVLTREVGYRFLALFLTALEAVFIKEIIIRSSPLVAFVSWCWFGALFSIPIVFFYVSRLMWQKTATYSLLAVVACIGLMQLSTNYVLAKIQVGYALAFFQLSVILSILFGRQFFREENIAIKLVGGFIMIAGASLITIFAV